MAGSKGSSPIPAWLTKTPSVTLSLASSGAGAGPVVPWQQQVVECCREVEEGHRAWAAHKKEAAWRLRRVELQMESEKASRRREKSEEVEARVRALREEQGAALEKIEAEYSLQLAGLRRDADAKDQKLADLWAAKHASLSAFLLHMGPPSS